MKTEIRKSKASIGRIGVEGAIEPIKPATRGHRDPVAQDAVLRILG